LAPWKSAQNVRDQGLEPAQHRPANGQEFTTDVSLRPQLFSPNIAAGKADHDLVLRGAPAGDRQPFQFKALEDAVITPEPWECWRLSPKTGFRVVADPPPAGR
jgi:hypothetical protein